MSEKSSTFVGMNDEMKLRLAYAEIARLKDEMATANRGQVDLIAHDQALRADFERQREEDRQFFKAQQDNMKEFYMQQMKEQAERHKEELKHLREENLENVKRIMKDSANHQKASDNLIASLNEKITKLTSMLEKSSLSASEAQWLARYRQRQRFKRNAEQKNLLKSGKEVTREEEKSDWPEDSNDDVPSTPSSASGDQTPAKKKKKALDKRSTRTDYQKNKPYTTAPIYHMLHEYFTLPEGGHFVKRDGKVETWWYRELIRIPEHYEEHFYEVASYYVPGHGGGVTRPNTRLIKGVSFDLELITYVLTEHFAYNTPFTRIVEKLSHMGLNMNEKTLGVIVHKIISYIRKEMKDVWEATIKKTHNWMIDETSGLVGVKTDEGVRKYLKRYFWGIKANVQKLVWFIYEHGSRGLKAIRQFLDNFIGFFTTDGYVVYKVYDDDELHPDQHRSACLTHIRRKFVESLEENHSLSMWFIDEIGRLFGIEHDCKKAGLTADQVLVERLQRSKPIMDRIKEKFERFARSNYKGLGALTKKALKYIKTEWSAMQTILQDGNLELSNNLAEQMMRHIKLNLKNCLNIGSEDSALDYAFMFSVIESCNMNKLSPGCYIKELVSRLTAKPVCTAEKVALLPCFMQK